MADPPNPSTLRLETVTGDGRTVIVVQGDVDSATAPQLEAVIDSLTEDIRTIELDLVDAGFFDSTGVSVMAAALQRLEAVGGKLELRNVPPPIMRLLSITDLLRFVTIL